MLSDDVKALREEFHAVVLMEYRLLAAKMRYDARLMDLKAEHGVPVGHSIDVHGDGTVKPDAECKQP